MNNLSSIDHAVKDWMHDHDHVLSKYCQEYPRSSLSYTRRTDRRSRPWGSVSLPVYMAMDKDELLINEWQYEPTIDEDLGSNKHVPVIYKPGVWYHCTQSCVTEHNELAGLMNFIKMFSVRMDLPFRRHQSINILNRIRMLPMSNQTQ